MWTPQTPVELAEALHRASMDKRTITLEGAGTKRAMAGPVETADEPGFVRVTVLVLALAGVLTDCTVVTPWKAMLLSNSATVSPACTTRKPGQGSWLEPVKV